MIAAPISVSRHLNAGRVRFVSTSISFDTPLLSSRFPIMDRAQTYTVDSLLPKDDNQADDQPGDVLKAFRSFILEFRLDNNFIYRWVVVLRAIGLLLGC